MKRGFITTIIIIIVAIVLLKVWLGFDIFKWLNQPPVKEFLLKIWAIIVEIWEKYLEASVKELFKSLRDLKK